MPYNAYLLQKYDAHINVEVCASVKSVKYLFKYVFKGHDRATVHVTDAGTPNPQTGAIEGAAAANIDEIGDFIDARYVRVNVAAVQIPLGLPFPLCGSPTSTPTRLQVGVL